MEVRQYGKKELKTCSAEQRADMLKKARKEHDKIVKGKFEFIDAGGGWFEFNYRLFPGEPITFIKIIHGEECELPLGVVRMLNNCVRKIRKFGMQQNSSIGEMGMLPARGLPSSFETSSRVRFTNIDYFGAAA